MTEFNTSTLTVARAWKRFDRLSVAELFAERYSRNLGVFASLMLLAAMSGKSPTARSARRNVLSREATRAPDQMITASRPVNPIQSTMPMC